MTIRSLDLLDLPSLARYSRDVLPLDSARMLTRGNPLGAAALLSYLNPRRHIYTAVSTDGAVSFIGQVAQQYGETFARLSFLAPSAALDGGEIALLDHLAAQAGEWGALHLLAEVDEQCMVFKSLRKSGFSMYAWQRVWKLAELPPHQNVPAWQETVSSDLIAIQSMHSQIVPALIHPVDSAPRKPGGLVCKTKGEMKAYISLDSGPAGIWLQPLVHPDSDCVPEKFSALLDDIPLRAGRPVYVCVRSYQAWLESALEGLGAEAGPRQAVMVKRLAKMQKVEEKISVMEKALKPAAPIASLKEMLYSGKEKK
ncbi:MAG: hypothetical protein QMD04_00410 [Anaerolineales bacterium]|nr:hypothetical protein [Anaerolineales bacterium]